LKSRTKS